MNVDEVLQWLGRLVVIPPAILLLVLGLSAIFRRPLNERRVGRLTAGCVMSGLACAAAVLGVMLITGERHVPVEFGHWVVIPEEHFHFHLKLIFDRLSVPFVILSFVLVGTIGAFANRYLHREPGYDRFFVCFAMFLLGMIVASVAGTIETLFLGWELVGLSSALLVAFFHDRSNPVINGLRIWSIYRIADAAFLVAAVVLHRLTGAGDFEGLMGTGAWPLGAAALTSQQALIVGLLLLFAAAGKSALLPFSGWLPRAMEGPTPSSAVFYGALSVHLGAFLLLRVSPILELSGALSATVVVLGLASALFGAMAARVQSDAKTALAFASLTQVGIITAEIGFGLRYIALVHIIGHACLRTLQLLRAPSMLHDYHRIENAIGDHLPEGSSGIPGWIPRVGQSSIYRFSFERGHLDAMLDRFIVSPFVAIFRLCDEWEQHWTDFLTGGPSREFSARTTTTETAEEP
ncbi:MAG: oxidoreductase [Phycisphaerales bacterium]|nr:oxidoreductase [Phycisphaerales bacterium]MCB9858589.1 oxidoreductase [Phycisphaerales bacterium]